MFGPTFSALGPSLPLHLPVDSAISPQCIRTPRRSPSQPLTSPPSALVEGLVSPLVVSELTLEQLDAQQPYDRDRTLSVFNAGGRRLSASASPALHASISPRQTHSVFAVDGESVSFLHPTSSVVSSPHSSRYSRSSGSVFDESDELGDGDSATDGSDGDDVTFDGRFGEHESRAPVVSSGSANKLIETLVDINYRESQYREFFLLTYREFATPLVLLEKLLRLFEYYDHNSRLISEKQGELQQLRPPPMDKMDRLAQVFQLSVMFRQRIFAVIKNWMKNYFEVDFCRYHGAEGQLFLFSELMRFLSAVQETSGDPICSNARTLHSQCVRMFEAYSARLREREGQQSVATQLAETRGTRNTSLIRTSLVARTVSDSSFLRTDDSAMLASAGVPIALNDSRIFAPSEAGTTRSLTRSSKTYASVTAREQAPLPEQSVASSHSRSSWRNSLLRFLRPIRLRCRA